MKSVTGLLKSKIVSPERAEILLNAGGILIYPTDTAFGIGSSALAIIFYSYFTTKIDKMTYSIDEAGVAIVQNFASHHS